MQLMEIEEPVQDRKGYVYERSAVERFITSSKKPVMCPASGEFVVLLWHCRFGSHD